MLNRHAGTGHSHQDWLFGRGTFIGNEPKLPIPLAEFQEFRLLLCNLLIQGCHFAASFGILPRNRFHFLNHTLDRGFQIGKSKNFVARGNGRLTVGHLVGDRRLFFLFLGQL